MHNNIKLFRMKQYRRLPGRGKRYVRMNKYGGGINFLNFIKKTGRKVMDFGKAAAKFALDQAKQIAPAVAKEVAPALLTTVSTAALQKASEKGAPDALVNLANEGAQRAARSIANTKTKELDNTQALVSDFISQHSMDLLGKMMAGNRKTGQGVRRVGDGVRRVGDGVRRVGDGVRRVGGTVNPRQGGLFVTEATNLNSRMLDG